MAILDVSWSTSCLVVVLTGLLFLLRHYASPTLDPLEPPLLKPRAPLVGHLISMLREGGSFYVRLFKDSQMPICTLPVLNGKLYVINAPDLIQSALRNNDISFDPFLVEFSVGMWGLSENAANCIKDETNLKGGLTIIHTTLMGEPLYRLTLNSLRALMAHLNRIEPHETLNIPDVFMWLRDIVTQTTATALFGEKNPITLDDSELLWIYDKQSMLAAFGAPEFVMRKAIDARRELNKRLLSYYKSGGYNGKGVSDIIHQRAIYLRSTGFTDDDLAHMELMLLWVGVTNTVPAMFWLLTQILTNPGHTARVRAEISAITTITDGPAGRTATFDIREVEKSCPFLVACYQEILRLYLHSVGNRRVMKDTKIQDTEGRKYLLKKGCNIQWPPSVTHFTNDTWGQDVDTFRPERILNATTQDEKKRRPSMLAFGGGKNLCPGRRFAVSEMLAFVGILALSFDVEGLNLPEWKDGGIGVGPRQPDWGSLDRGACLKKKQGWEDVTWSF
ncbi:7-alpha-hydroxycholest-4-en-3-one 12-alpha-hydroxylase [Fusarium heterosporum]|uniref:7-alpha-hydroxycholest-4-en-3-one 12-alpha-hydroxylase n=1 Tax=Fusarium heterosporum TaxID=42747 RepID=A0A8H5TXH6_FUSHE|nr:7-alpha-hydroxycholest-4-en-3-one 12-alpha-hydroxylase [Fusarium heterosporum]